jgi:hypothetical protein
MAGAGRLEIAVGHERLELQAELGSDVRDPGHPADRAGRVALERPVVSSHEHLEPVAGQLDEVGDPARVPRALLHGDDALVALGEADDRLHGEVLARRLRVVVEHHRKLRSGGHGGEVRVQLALVGDVGGGRQAHDAARPERRGLLRAACRARAIRRRDAHRNARSARYRGLCDHAALVVGQRARLAHRAAHHHVGDAALHQPARVVGQPLGGEGQVVVEGREQRGDDGAERHCPRD